MMCNDKKVEGSTEWVRRGNSQGVVDNTSTTAYREFIRARDFQLGIKAKLEKLERLLGEEND